MVTFFLQLIPSLITVISNKISKQHLDNNIYINTDIKVNLDATEATSNNGTSTDCDDLKGRIVFAMDLLKRIDSDQRITPTAIASDLGIDDLEKVDLIVRGITYPYIPFVKQFSKRYNINEEWLISGDSYKRKPYSHCCNFMSTATDIPNIYEEGNYKYLYVCTADNDERWTCLVLVKQDIFTVAHCDSNWRISSHIGEGGRYQLVELYKALCHFQYSHNVFSLKISPIEFDQLTTGEIHFEAILKGKQCNYMWKFFLDIDRKNMSKIDYQKMYGEEFISAQDNVFYALNRNIPDINTAKIIET